MNHHTDPGTIKSKIAEERQKLINITEVNDLFLTELVGEGVLEEETKEGILDGRTRTEINKRFFDWLCKSDDSSVYKIFLSKLREYGQKHIANLLDGTQGELPLIQSVKQTLQKMMRELTRNIDLDSGLLESLMVVNVISEIDYQEIKAGQTKIARAKRLWDVLLRGSDLAFEKFKGEIFKTQPEMIKLIEQQDGTINRPHVDCLKKHCNVLARCMDVNLLTIAYLESKGVIDKGIADMLKSTSELGKKIDQIYNLLIFKPKDVFDLFLDVMKENEQKHVVNLLMENKGQQPLLEEHYKRLVIIKPDLIIGIKKSTHLVNAIRALRETDDTDFAISHHDYEVLTEKCVTNTEINSALVDSVLRRTDHSLESLENALRETGQGNMAEFLKKGIMFGADVKTTRTDQEEAIANLFNEKISIQSSEKPVSVEDQQFAENLNTLNGLNIPLIAAQASNSIMMYTYCKEPDDAKKYVQLLNSGKLQAIYENMLNILLKIIEPDNQQPLEATIVLEDKDKNIIQEFTGLDELCTMETRVFTDKSSCPLHGRQMNVYCHDCSTWICSLCIEQEHQTHNHSDAEKDFACKREKLQQDLELISSCRSVSLELKDNVENERAKFVKRIEEAEVAVRKKCDDLKEKVENFKQMLLRDQASFKERTLSIMSEQRRALESYVSVVSDFEERVRQLIQYGTPSEVCSSFGVLHERAEKLQQKQPEPPSSKAVEIFGGQAKLSPSIPKLPEESHPVEISEIQPLLKPLEQHRATLEYLLDPYSGLFDELRPCLPRKKVRAIENERSYQKRNQKLIDAISEANKYEEFLTALVKTKQNHVANFLNANGVYNQKFAGEWPAFLSNEWKILQANTNLLVEKLNLFDLVDGLLSWNIITLVQKDILLQIQSKRDRNAIFLDMLGRGTIANYYRVLEFFRTSNQIEVAHWMGLPVTPVFGGFQVQFQPVNIQKEVAELYSAFGEVAAFRLR